MNMYYKFKTKTLTIGGPSAAKRFAREAIDASQWYTFEPLPDGKYEFTVKAKAFASSNLPFEGGAK